MLSFTQDTFNTLMPMGVLLDRNGVILHIGPSLQKMCPKLKLSQNIDTHISVLRPRHIANFKALRSSQNRSLTLSFLQDEVQNLKGVLAECGSQYILNLRLGSKIKDQVSQFELKNADFSPADATLDVMYLLTSNEMFMGEATDLANRLHGAKQQAEKQASTDPLTGLSNRRALDGYLKRLMQRSTGFGLMQIDLDFFKAANDTFGHAAGDYVLMEVARVLRSETRATDMVARVGGDEFILVLADVIDVDLLSQIAARIVSHLAEPIAYKDIEIQIGASIGIAIKEPQAVDSAEQLISFADAALYKSKEKGRGCYSLHSEVA